MTSIIDILSKSKEDTITHIYIKCKKRDNKITPYEYNSDEINDIIKKMRLKNGRKIIQIESYFRDMVKIEIDDDITYYKKRVMGHMIDDILIQNIDMKIVEKYQIPNLTEYDYKIIKNITIYEEENYNIYIIKNEYKDTWQICIDMKLYNKSQLLKLFDTII